MRYNDLPHTDRGKQRTLDRADKGCVCLLCEARPFIRFAFSFTDHVH